MILAQTCVNSNHMKIIDGLRSAKNCCSSGREHDVSEAKIGPEVKRLIHSKYVGF